MINKKSHQIRSYGHSHLEGMGLLQSISGSEGDFNSNDFSLELQNLFTKKETDGIKQVRSGEYHV